MDLFGFVRHRLASSGLAVFDFSSSFDTLVVVT